MHDVIIIGGGPAGMSAARWCDEMGLDTLLLEQADESGGQLHRIYNPIENYLGVHAAGGADGRGGSRSRGPEVLTSSRPTG